MTFQSSIPRATYRLQLNNQFTFKQAMEIVPYLANLGISHCYISPFLKARTGSMHGYDIVDHNSLNPEIGSSEDFDRFVETLHQHGMGLILDIVPNHMAVLGSDNAWWLDVLENGESSSYASFFDIDWHPLKEELEGKVLVPVLHDHYGAVLESGELKLCFREESGEFDIWYRTHRFPIGPREYPRILNRAAAKLAGELDQSNRDLLELQSVTTAFSNLPGREELDTARIAERNRDKEISKRRLAALCFRAPTITAALDSAAVEINGVPADPSSFEGLHELIKAQTFRLANWRVASDDINYRRFFDTNDLAGVRTENEPVFEATHKLILNFIEQGKVDGLRIDHPDGLYDPAQYFDRLARRVSEARSRLPSGEKSSSYVAVEKILTGPERLRKDWPVSGTTGYDFSNLVNGLFIDPSSARRFDRIYHQFTGEDTDVAELNYLCRRLIIRIALVSELNVLSNRLARIALSKRHTCDFTLNSLRDALTEVVASFPVYRTYVSSTGLSQDDERYIGEAIAEAKFRSPAGDTTVFDFIRDVLLTKIADGQDPAYKNAVLTFAMKFQQFTSPVMAKGLEDTSFYRYNRLVSLNDVGGDLQRFGITTADFHKANKRRGKDWPHTMLATSTHDSKRSEDVRTRIDVLSEMPASWKLHVRAWKQSNRQFKKEVNGQSAPSSNDEYLLYQTLVGAWPVETPNSQEEWKALHERITAYLFKAMREAKQHTSWINQNSEYEAAVSSFVENVLTPDNKFDNKFLDQFLPFQRHVARVGVWNSLSETLLKFTAPGVPDIYQGNEILDFSLVDPDNRRPVDYLHRQQALDSTRDLQNNPSDTRLEKMLDNPNDGLSKLYVIWKCLRLRGQHPELFEDGSYTAIPAIGEKAEHVVAFLRHWNDLRLLVVAPRLIHQLVDGSEVAPIGAEVWKDTYLNLPTTAGAAIYRNILTGEEVPMPAAKTGRALPLSDALARFPVGLYFSS